VIDFGMLPPEVNSGLMYAGPGAGPMMAAAAAWSSLGAELNMAASAFTSVITELSSGPWLGPSAIAMVSAAMPYATWLSTTGALAEETGTEGFVAVSAYEAAFMATVPPPVIAANRALLAALIATNFLGINTAAIAATEAAYMEMWAQDAGAMYAYAAGATAAVAGLNVFAPAPEVVNPAGVVTQGISAGPSTNGSVASTVQSVMSGLGSGPAAANVSPGPTASPGASGLLSNLLGTSASDTPIPGMDGTLVQNYATLPGWFGMETGSSVLGALFNPAISNALTSAATPAAAEGTAAAAEAAAAEGAAEADLGAGMAAADIGGVAGSVGALSVPSTWGWAAAGLPSALGSVTLAAPAAAAATDVGAGFGFPFMFPPGAASAAGRTTTAGLAEPLAGGAAAKFLPRMSVLGETAPATAGESKLPPVQIPVPAGLPSNGDTPPGYQMVISYLPVEPAKADA
jgi:PPE-repeat protein